MSLMRKLFFGMIFVLATLSPGTSWVHAAETPLSPDDVANATRIEHYLNTFDSLRSRFVQISSNGGFAEGEVFVLRPGNFRFDYDPPATALLIANGLTLLYYDKELKQASFITQHR